MYNALNWKDHVTEFPNRRQITDNGDGTVNLTKAQGRIIQQGTPQSAKNFHNMEYGIFDANAAVSMLAVALMQSQRLTETDPDLYDALLSGRMLAVGNLQQHRLIDDTIKNVAESLENHAESVQNALDGITQQKELAAADFRGAIATLAVGSLQRQYLNDEKFDLIAAEALGESHEITMTNTQKFPFNSTIDNPVTVALNTRRKNLFYSVETEVTAHTGEVGNIAITNKQLNGFKISFDGSGTSVTVILRIKGGMSHG